MARAPGTHEVCIAQSVVIRTQAISDFVGLLSLKEARLASLVGRDDEHRDSCDYWLVAAALNGCKLVGRNGDIVFQSLEVCPKGRFLS